MSLRIDVWSDLACPWCYIGKRRLAAAVADPAALPAGVEVDVVWRAFELDPHAARTPDGTPMVERLARNYRVPPAQAQAMLDRTTATAAEDGLALRFDLLRPSNTFDAHRLLQLARERGTEDALAERLLAGYFTAGDVLADHATLAGHAAAVGLDAAEVAALLAGDGYTREVRADEATARELGITGVPCFVLDGKLQVSGAQPAAVLRAAIVQASS